MPYSNNFLKQNGNLQILIIIIALQKKAADYYSSENNPVQAIYHAVKSGDELFIAQKLVDHGCFISEVRSI